MQKPYLENLNDNQQNAVCSTSKRMLVLAGAGSGKTKVLTCRVAFLLEELKINPYNILALTFTNKSAKEMKDRASLLNERAKYVRLSTFHSFGAYFLRMHAKLLDYSSGFSIYDTNDSLSVLKRVVPAQYQKKQLKAISYAISNYKNSLLNNMDYRAFEETNLNFHDIFEAYEEAMKQNNAFDFDDLIYKVALLLENNADLLKQTKSYYKAILVDEYQDTNPLQAKLLKLMTSDDCYLCVVGDEDQSIYSFRGADARIILDYVHDYEDVQIVKLEENYRSTQKILSCANNLIANNTERIGKTLFSSGDSGNDVQIKRTQNEMTEAEFCANLWQADPSLSTAILYRTNAQSRTIEKVFSQKHIKYRIVGSLRFFAREEVKTALSFLALLVNPDSSIDFERIANKPSRGLSGVIKTVLETKKNSDMDCLETLSMLMPTLSKNATNGAKEFIGLYNNAKDELEEISLSLLLDRFLKDSGLFEHYKEIDESEHTDRTDNLKELVSALTTYGVGEKGLLDFLETTALDEKADKKDDDYDFDNMPTLMTIHRAKGLEFDRVFIMALEEGLIPSLLEINPLAIEEERRLLYVAITRAKKELYLCLTESRTIYGRYNQSQPSRFLKELELPTDNSDLSDITSVGNYSVGTLVKSEAYGVGKIIAIEVINDRVIASIKLQNGKTIKLFPEYTYLEVISSSELD